MQITQASMLQSLRAVRSFLDTNASRLGGIGKTGASKRLDDAIAELVAHAENQSGSILKAKGSTQEQNKIRVELLRDHMKPIARIAKADLPGTPNIEPLSMPKSWYKGERLAAAAKGMAQTAAKFAPTFIAAGLPEDFAERLHAKAEAMVATIEDRTTSQNHRVGATKGLKVKLTEGRKVVDIIDAFVQTVLKDDPILRAQWNSIRRVQLVRGGRPVSQAAPAPAPSQPTAE